MNLQEDIKKIKEMMGITQELVLEHYDENKLYSRDYILNIIDKKHVPRHIRKLAKELPYIDCTDSNGNTYSCTKIPQVIYVYLQGRY